MADKLEEALGYYRFALRDLLLGLDDTYYSYTFIADQFEKTYIGEVDTEDSSKHSFFIAIALRQLMNEGKLDKVVETFTPPFLRRNTSLARLPVEDPAVGKVAKVYDSLGTTGRQWLFSAFENIVRHFQKKALIDYLDKVIAEGNANPTIDKSEALDRDIDEDRWEPIKIDRSTREYQEAVEASDAALREIESSNGYAATEPEERNSIVATVKGTVEAIKSGMPSRAAIKEGLLKPLKYIAKKFPDATIGEIAKLALGKIITWLSTLL